MQLLPKLRTKHGEGVGVELFISHPDLETNETFLATDVAASVSTLTVDNGLKFANGDYIVLGRFGYEKAEIVRISGTPSATSMSVSTTSHAHNRGEQLRVIPYNQIAIERSTDSGSTYSALVTVSIRPDATETYYNHLTGASTDYYRVRFSNSATSDVSSYSDGIIATGFVENSAGAVIQDALISLGEKLDEDVFTKEFMLRALDEGRDEIDLHPAARKWSFRTVFDYDGGDCIPGRYQLTLPTDLRDPDTAVNMLSVRIGRDALPLDWFDKTEMNMWYQGVAHSTLTDAVTSASTTIVLGSTGDFDESGAVDFAAESISGTIDSADYTTNTESTKTLGTVTNITDSHAAARDVWQGASFGTPTAYTVNDGVMTFNQPFDDDLAGENIWLDYYSKKVVMNSFGDTFDEPFFRIYLPYMRFRIKLRKNPSMDIQSDPDFLMWMQKKEAQVVKEFGGQNMRLRIDTP